MRGVSDAARTQLFEDAKRTVIYADIQGKFNAALQAAPTLESMKELNRLRTILDKLDALK